MAEQTSTTPASATKGKTSTKPATKQMPPYNVVLLNDEDHTYEYVIQMLKALFGHPDETGFKLAKTVDTQGRAIVLTTHKERAEFKRDQIMGFGADYRLDTSKGSMSAIIEPVNDE